MSEESIVVNLWLVAEVVQEDMRSFPIYLITLEGVFLCSDV